MPFNFQLSFSVMQKRRIYWPYGNPRHDAWEVLSSAGQLVVRRNHELVNKGNRRCQGWDVWLNGKHLGAIGGRSLVELEELSRHALKSATRAACCSRYKKFDSGTKLKSRPNWGGSRPFAGRPLKGESKRVSISTTLDRNTLELIDWQRGKTSRGEFLDRLVQEALSLAHGLKTGV